MDLEQELMELKEELIEVEKEIEEFEIEPDDFVEEYEEALNDEGPVRVAGLEYMPAYVLKEVDYTAYLCGLNDFVGGIDKEDVSEYQRLAELRDDLIVRIEEIEVEED